MLCFAGWLSTAWRRGVGRWKYHTLHGGLGGRFLRNSHESIILNAVLLSYILFSRFILFSSLLLFFFLFLISLANFELSVVIDALHVKSRHLLRLVTNHPITTSIARAPSTLPIHPLRQLDKRSRRSVDLISLLQHLRIIQISQRNRLPQHSHIRSTRPFIYSSSYAIDA